MPLNPRAKLVEKSGSSALAILALIAGLVMILGGGYFIYKQYSERAEPPALEDVDFSKYVQFGFVGPITAVVVDPQGRRVGYDARQNGRVKEIQKASYMTNEKRTLSITIFDPLPGQYLVEVHGTEAGEYIVEASISSKELPVDKVRGGAVTGSSNTYLFNLESRKFVGGSPNMGEFELLQKEFLKTLPQPK